MAKKTSTGAGNLFQETAKSRFMRITGQRYDNMAARVKKKGFPGLPFDKDKFREHLLAAMNGHYDGYVVCPYCNGFFTVADMGIDHAIPLSRGGEVELTNLEFPCKPCNSRKGAMTPTEYIMLMHFLDRTMPLAKQDVLNRLEISVQLVTSFRSNAATIEELRRSGEWQRVKRLERQRRK